MGLKVCAVAVVVVVAGLVPRQAVAQQGPAGFVGGVGGVTFGTVTSAAVAGQIGVEIAPGLFVIGEVGYMRNVLPKELRDDLQDVVDLLEVIYDVPVNLEVSVPALYGFGGVRWRPSDARVAPFVEGGVGVGHISLMVDEAEVLGFDVSDIVKDELDEDSNATKFLFALGGGISARLADSVATDIGFRYTRIATEDPAINTSMVYGAVKVGF